MFCSKCGKTIKPEETNCPSCGAVVGDSRFEGNGYTAAQPRYVSNESEEAARKVVPYTRTTYTTDPDEGGEGGDGGDVYSRTTYRPILADEPKQKEAVQEEALKPAEAHAEPVASPVDELDVEALYRQDEQRIDGGEAAPESEEDKPVLTRAERAGRTEKRSAEPIHHKRATLPVREPNPDEDPDDDIAIAPLRPIKKTGISPEVQQYMERMNQTGQAKPKRGLKGLLGQQADEQPAESGDLVGAVADAAAIDAGADPLGVIQEGGANDADVAINPDGTVAVHRGAPAWLKPLAIVACIAIILCVAAWALLQYFANSSPLDGVSYNLLQQGITLIKSKADPVYRNELIKSLQADTTGADMADKLTAAHAEIAALLPENPMKNDEAFIKALDGIQDTIDAAAYSESLAEINRNSPTYETLKQAANDKWDEVTNGITKLEGAKELSEIQGVIQDSILAAATPEPSVEPTPTPKARVLKPGTNNNANVKKLQERLAKLGWFKGGKADGDYGPNTQQVVKKYQEYAGLEPVNGICDQATWDHIMGPDALTYAAAKAAKEAAASASQTLVPAETDPPAADAAPVDNTAPEEDAAVAS